MTDAHKILRELCHEVYSGADYASGHYTQSELRSRMGALAAEAAATVENALAESSAQVTEALGALDELERGSKSGKAAIAQFEISGHVTLPQGVRHDRLHSLERLARHSAAKARTTDQKVKRALAKVDETIETVKLYSEVSARASVLAVKEDGDWEARVDDLASRSATHGEREARNAKQVIGIALGLVVGALCVWLGWPLVQWSWSQTMDMGWGGVVLAVVVTGAGAALLETAWTLVGVGLLIVGGIALALVLLGPSILVGGGIAGYYLANFSTGFLGEKEREHSAELDGERHALINSWISANQKAGEADLAGLRSEKARLSGISAMLGKRIEEADLASEAILAEREKLYFGERGPGEFAAAAEKAWEDAHRPPPKGYGLEDGKPIYAEMRRRVVRL